MEIDPDPDRTEELIARVSDLTIARAMFDLAVVQYPVKLIMLCHNGRILRRSDRPGPGLWPPSLVLVFTASRGLISDARGACVTNDPICRRCAKEDSPAILSIVNAAAEAYRGAIPVDEWHEPYMPAAALAQEIDAGVVFWGCERDGQLAGVMGFQSVRDVDLIRHAYVLPSEQRRGIGGTLLRHLRGASGRQMLVGTWSAADWAIRFYERHGFALVSTARTAALLSAYWSVSSRQAQASVVLANPPL